MWKKQGLIWSPRNDRYWERSHAQVPVVDTGFEDKWRVYYASRDNQNRSHISWIDVEPGNPKKIIGKCMEPFLSPNHNPGYFDDCGVMPTSIVNINNKKYLYYIGWTQKVTVPYHNSIGLVIIEEDHVTRLSGPVISSSLKDPGFQGTAFVMTDFWGWKMWYMSSLGWVKDPATNKMEPLYNIRFAHSENGINWTADRSCLELSKSEGGISSATVVCSPDNVFHMWYSVRGMLDYRTKKENTYRIGYAISNNARDWVRDDKKAGISRSDLGWDSKMICYPYIVKHDDKLFMFYNGNGFGQTGFGYATMELPWR